MNDLWEIRGTGMYWGPFYVKAADEATAYARAQDILAGVGPGGQRFYGTAELEIISVTRAGELV